MIIYVNVKPNSKEEKIEVISENEYKIWLKEKAIDGKANNALIKILAKQFDMDYRKIKIKNPSSRKKIIEIC